jgi:hypothetical protein
MTDTQQPASGTAGTGSPVHHGHGSSIAAWTAVGVLILGALVVAIGVVASSWAVAIIGAVICVGGVITGKVLATMGFGIAGRPEQH